MKTSSNFLLGLVLFATSALSAAQELASRGDARVSVQDFDAQHFMLTDARRAAIRNSENDVLKTIDEVLNIRTFALRKDPFSSFTAVEKSYANLQSDRNLLATALAVEERRTRAKFVSDPQAAERRARETWLQDNEKYFGDAEVDITVIHFDLAKRSWSETVSRIEEIKKQIAQNVEFDKLVAKYSDDPGVATNGGKVLGVKAKTADPPLVKPLFNTLKIAEISEPIAARRGLYMVRLDAKRARAKKSFDEAKEEILSDLLEKDARESRVKLLESLQKEPITFNEATLNQLLPKPVKDPMEAIRKLYREQGINVSNTPPAVQKP